MRVVTVNYEKPSWCGEEVVEKYNKKDFERLNSFKYCKSVSFSSPVIDELPNLEEIPLKSYSLHNCTGLKDLKPVIFNKNLTQLAVPKHIKNIDYLKQLENLELLIADFSMHHYNLEKFWRDYDRKKKEYNE